MNLGNQHFSAYYYNKLLFENGEISSEEREQIVRKLLVMPGGPCSIPWNLELPIEYEEDEEDEEDEE